MGNTEKFEMIANTYDTPERIQVAKVTSDTIRNYIVDGKNKTAIDFGCGTGLVGLNLVNEFQSILFLDTSEKMIGQVKRKIIDLNLPNASTLSYDLEEKAVADLRADYIFMAQVLLHIEDTELILARLLDMLNEAGHLIIVDFDKNGKVTSPMVHNGFHQAELTDRMEKLGYRDIQSETFYHGSKLFMGQDASMFILDARK